MAFFEDLVCYEGEIRQQISNARKQRYHILSADAAIELKLLSWSVNRKQFWQQPICTSTAALIHPDGRVKFIHQYRPNMRKPYTGNYLCLGSTLEESLNVFDSHWEDDIMINGRGLSRKNAKSSEALKHIVQDRKLLDRYINVLYFSEKQKEMMNILLPPPREVAFSAVIEISNLHGTSFIGKGLLEQGVFYAALEEMRAYR